jgi:hypothetical protein
MTERDDHRTGSGGVKDNVRDELAEAAGYRKEATPEEEEQASSGGQGHCPGRACRVARSSLAGNSGRAKGVSEG